jgi:hypothetical protein
MVVYKIDFVQTNAIDPCLETATVVRVESHLCSEPSRTLVPSRVDNKTC